MEITEVRIHLRNEEKLKAYATITFDKCFVIRDLKIIQGNSGMFVAMPSRKKPDGTYKDIAHPLDNDTRKMIESRILEAYKEEIVKLKDQVNKVDEATVTRTEGIGRTEGISKTFSDIDKSIEDKISG